MYWLEERWREVQSLLSIIRFSLLNSEAPRGEPADGNIQVFYIIREFELTVEIQADSFVESRLCFGGHVGEFGLGQMMRKGWVKPDIHVQHSEKEKLDIVSCLKVHQPYELCPVRYQ
jgi:hypothetical protein